MPLTITQEDREAAAKVEALLNYVTVSHEWEMLLQAFARHRIQALEAAAKVAEGQSRLRTHSETAAAIRTLYGSEPYKDGDV